MPLIEKYMDELTRENLESLMQDQQHFCLSIYMPVHKRGKEAQQDPVRLKNLLKSAESLLGEMGMRPSEAYDLTAPAKALLDDSVFWTQQSSGLSLFLSRHSAYVLRLPLQFDEMIFCGRNFTIRPLLPLLYRNNRYYVLVLSKANVKLLRCTKFNVSEMDLRDTVRSVRDLLAQFEFDIDLQHRSSTITGVPGQGFGGAIFHGHGASGDEANMKERAAAFFRQLDGAVCEALNGEHAPMVLAGVEYIRAMYRESSRYSAILAEGIDGNFDQKSSIDLARKAWGIVSPHFDQQRQRDLERLRILIGSGDRKATADIRSIVSGAWSRMVEALFVPYDDEYWGRFDPSVMEVEVHEEPIAGDQELLNLACIYTLRGGGQIHGCRIEELPEKAPVGAIFW